MGMNKKNVPRQEEPEKLDALLSSLREEEARVFREFIEQALEQKEGILALFDPKKSCIRIEESDADFYSHQIDIVWKLLLTDSRIRAVDMDYGCERIELYPARPEHEYAPVGTSGEKHYGRAALNQYFNSFSEAVEWFEQDESEKCSITIEKTVTLNGEDFAFFSGNIRQDAPFLEDPGCGQPADSDGTFHCVLVKPRGIGHGIMVCKDVETGTFYSGYLPSLEWFEQDREQVQARPASYTDKNGNPIREGMFLQFDDGSVEEVFACMDADGGEDLGINASNETYLEYHGTDREYYPLSNFPADCMEILGQRQDVGQDKKEEMGMGLC